MQKHSKAAAQASTLTTTSIAAGTAAEGVVSETPAVHGKLAKIKTRE
jgi:hypothetical protein